MLERAPLGLALCLALVLGPAVALAEPDPCAVSETWVDLAHQGGVGGTGRGEPQGGVGGTGLAEPHGGVGGTGHFDGGVGGTGRSAEGGVGGTGIFGTITGFGSICVNGERVAYEADAPVERWGERADTRDLAVGQLVWVVASDAGGQLRADHIEILATVAGPLEALDAGAGQLLVDGRTVALAEGAQVVDASGAGVELASLEIGTPIAVSGIEDADGVTVATRVLVGEGARDATSAPSLETLVERTGLPDVVSVEGFVAPAGAGQVRVGGMTVELPDGAPELRSNERVWLRGHLTRERVLRPDRWMVRPERPRPPRREVVERPRSRDEANAVRPEPTREQRPARAARVQRPERPVRVERPERVERPQRPARVDRPALERPERPKRAVRVLLDRPPSDLRPVERPTRVNRAQRMRRHKTDAAK